jgi:hypothetical protein
MLHASPPALHFRRALNFGKGQLHGDDPLGSRLGCAERDDNDVRLTIKANRNSV